MISLKNVTKQYRVGPTLVNALKDISLDIGAGETVAIVGRSGSGKSTLLNIIGGIDLATSGDVWIHGVLASKQSDGERTDFRARHLGYIFQDFGLLPLMTVLENVALPLQVRGEPAAAARQRAQELLDLVGIPDKARCRITELSGGQRQRVAIARALVTGPKIVLADEFTANLDARTADEVLELMRDCQKRYGTTIIFATHDPRVSEFATRTIRLQDGVVLNSARAELVS